MPESRPNRRQRLDDLLIRRSMEPLDESDAALLDSLLAEAPDTNVLAYERAATAVWLAVAGAADSMPDGLRQKILSQASPRERD